MTKKEMTVSEKMRTAGDSAERRQCARAEARGEQCASPAQCPGQRQEEEPAGGFARRERAVLAAFVAATNGGVYCFVPPNSTTFLGRARPKLSLLGPG